MSNRSGVSCWHKRLVTIVTAIFLPLIVDDSVLHGSLHGTIQNIVICERRRGVIVYSDIAQSDHLFNVQTLLTCCVSPRATVPTPFWSPTGGARVERGHPMTTSCLRLRVGGGWGVGVMVTQNRLYFF